MGTYGRPTEQSAHHVSRLIYFHLLRTPDASWFEMCPDSSHADVVWPMIEFHVSYWERFEETQERLVPLVVEWALRIFPELEHPEGVLHATVSAVNHYSRVPVGHLDHAPPISGAADGVYLCGDWMRWDTAVNYREKAFVTGVAVADAICQHEGKPSPEIIPMPVPAAVQQAAQRLTDGIA